MQIHLEERHYDIKLGGRQRDTTSATSLNMAWTWLSREKITALTEPQHGLGESRLVGDWDEVRHPRSSPSETLTVREGRRKTSLKIGTCNVRTLLQRGKLENLKMWSMRCLVYKVTSWTYARRDGLVRVIFIVMISGLFIPEVKHIREAWHLY